MPDAISDSQDGASVKPSQSETTLKNQSPAHERPETAAQRLWRIIKYILTGRTEGPIWKPEVIELYERIRRRLSGPEDGPGQISSQTESGQQKERIEETRSQKRPEAEREEGHRHKQELRRDHEAQENPGAIQYRDELRAGSHVLLRYYDRSYPQMGVLEKWQLSRVTDQGERMVVMEGDGHDITVIRHGVKDKLTASRIERELPEVRELTRDVYSVLALDYWPSPAGIIDFGIDTGRHFAALQSAVRNGDITPRELDAALGNGRKIEALIKPSNPYHGVKFETSWDVLNNLVSEQKSELNPHASPDRQLMLKLTR
jgi:hypothetical protein